MTTPSEPPPSAPRIQIQLPAALEPVYANFAILTNSSSEIVIDHAQLLPQVPHARVVAACDHDARRTPSCYRGP